MYHCNYWRYIVTNIVDSLMYRCKYRQSIYMWIYEWKFVTSSRLTWMVSGSFHWKLDSSSYVKSDVTDLSRKSSQTYNKLIEPENWAILTIRCITNWYNYIHEFGQWLFIVSHLIFESVPFFVLGAIEIHFLSLESRRLCLIVSRTFIFWTV